MSKILPYVICKWYLTKEREHVLKFLNRYQIISEKQAKDLLYDSLHTIFSAFEANSKHGKRKVESLFDSSSPLFLLGGECARFC